MDNKVYNGKICDKKYKDNPIIFILEDFRIIFINISDRSDIEISPDEIGYVWGRLANGKRIAIFIGRDNKIKFNFFSNQSTVYTTNYIVFSNNNISYDGIKFTNGILKALYPCMAMYDDPATADKINADNSDNDQAVVYRIKPDEKKFDIKFNKKNISWLFKTNVNKKWAANDGTILSNTESVLYLGFGEKHNSLDQYLKYLKYITDMFSFLSFRGGVGFQKINLTTQFDKNEIIPMAECFIKNNNTWNNVDFAEVIPIRSMDDEKLKRLFKHAVRLNPKSNALPIHFLPSEEKELRYMSDIRLRNLCTDLELEANISKVKGTGDGSASQIYALYDRWCEQLLFCLFQGHRYFYEVGENNIKRKGLITFEEIKKVIDVRDDFTHIAYGDMNASISFLIRLLIILSYINALHRVGFDDNAIINIIKSSWF